MGNVNNDTSEQHETERFWSEANDAYVRLRADKDAWADYQNEIRLLEGGSMDGLENEPPYFSPDELAEILFPKS